MAKSLCIGLFTALAFFAISFVILSSCLGSYYDPVMLILILAALFFGMVATCTSMILKKLDVIVELTAAQSAKLRSLEAKSIDSKVSSDD